jgi:hypothetical protein
VKSTSNAVLIGERCWRRRVPDGEKKRMIHRAFFRGMRGMALGRCGGLPSQKQPTRNATPPKRTRPWPIHLPACGVRQAGVVPAPPSDQSRIPLLIWKSLHPVFALRT